MTDELVVLGVASSAEKKRLSVAVVDVRLDEAGEVTVHVREPWRGTRGTDDARQLADVHDVLANALDPARDGAPSALAIKRVERPFRGGPGDPYDQKTRFEGVAMVAAQGQGRRVFDYRTNEMGGGRELVEQVKSSGQFPSEKEAQDAVAAACSALCDLREARERGL